MLNLEPLRAAQGWTDIIPTGREVGDYYVWYKVLGDENHNDTEPKCIKVTIVPDLQVEQFTAAVNAVPGNKAGEGKGLVDNATAIYKTLTDAQKALVEQETMALYAEELAAFRKDRKFKSGDGYYRVLSNGDVTYLKPVSRDIEGVLVPNQVKKGKFFFKVIKVSNNAFRNCKNLKFTDAFVRAGKDGNLTVKVPGNKVNEYRDLFTGEGGLNGSVKAA